MKANKQFSTHGAVAVKPFFRRSIQVFNRHITSALIILLTIAFPACKSTNDQAAARVGSREISMTLVDSTLKEQIDANGGSASPLTPAELVAARLQVLDNLIKNEALYEKAQKDNLVPDDGKVNQEIQKRKQDAHLTEEQYQTQLKQSGLTEPEWREQVKRTLAITALEDAQKARVKPPADADIESYYNDHKNELIAERGADISTIVADPANGGDAGAEQRIRAIYDQLKSGTDFATVAFSKSEDPQSRAQGGNLGFGSEAALKQSFPTRPDIPQQLMSMTPGQYTSPTKDPGSGRWYIFKLNAKREQPQNLTIEDVRQQIVDKITQERQQVLLQSLMMVAMAESSIKNYLAEKIVQNPETIIMMRPSELLQQSTKPIQQPSPRFENENRNRRAAGSISNSNRTGNSNK
jgi:parvulin-like peptidyl-prolyl isomerase